MLHYKIGAEGEEVMSTVTTAGTYDVEISANGKLIAWVTRDGAIQSDETSRDVYVPTATVNEGGVYTFKSVKGTTPVELESEEQVFGEQTLYAPTAITATTFEGHFAFSTVSGTDLRLIGGSGLRVAKGKNIYIAIKGLEEGKTLTINYKVGNSADQIAFADAAIIKDAVAEAKVDSGKIYNITADGDILLKVSNANASLDILSVALNQTKTVNKPTISSTYTVNEDSYTYTIHYMEGATLHYTLPGETEQTASEGVSIDVNVTKIGDLTAYATYDGLTSETLTQRVYAPTPSIADNGVYKFAGVSSAMMKDYTLGTIGYGDAVPVGSLTLHKPDAVVSKTLDRFAFAPKLNENGKNAADWMLLSAGRLRAKSSAMADTLAILDLKKGEYVKITYSGGAELRYMEESTAKLAEGTDLLTSGQGYEILADGILLLTVPANEEKHCDITVISIANEEMVTAPTMALKDGVTNIVRLRQGASSFGKTVTTYFTTDGSKPTSDNGTAVNKSPYDITLDATCTLKALTISETGTKSEITEVTFIVKNETETEEVTELVSIEDDNNATVTAVTIGEETTTVTISANVGDTPVTAIADNVFTATNTANVAAIDLSETQVAMEGERNEIPALMNINQATLVYLPATANVTGTNVVAKTGAGETATYKCADFQITDGKESAVPHSFTAASAKLNRTFTADKRCTVCLPYEFKATGGTFYEFTGISSEGKVQMTAKEADSQLSANTPYIFVPNEGLGVISAENVEVSISDAPQTENEEAKFTFIGTFEKLTWTDPSGIYGFAAEDESGATIGQFVRVGSGASIDPCRAYLKYTGNSNITDVAQARSASPEELPAKLEIEWIPASSSVNHNNGDTTSMEDIGQSPEKGSENIYNMHGQRVNGDYKGMVVRNGKKMIKR